jgi:Tfp pilus assembly protein PilF
MGNLTFFSKLGNKTEGLHMLQRAMDIDRHNVEALMTLGGMMAELNKWTEAEHLFREAITEKPDFADVYYHYGTYLHLKGKKKSSKIFLNSILY